MKSLNPSSCICALVWALTALSGCATQGKPPPTIALDEPVRANPLPEAPQPVEVMEVPKVLPMPAQLKALGNTALPLPDRWRPGAGYRRPASWYPSAPLSGG